MSRFRLFIIVGMVSFYTLPFAQANSSDEHLALKETKILRAADPKFCQRILDESNHYRLTEDMDEFTFVLPNMLEWSVTPNTDKSITPTNAYAGPIYLAEFDADNDGKPDKVLKTEWSMGGVPDSIVNIVPPSQPLDALLADRENLLPEFVLHDPNKLDFEDIQRLVKHHDATYGKSDPHLDWMYMGVSNIEAFIEDKTTYFVAQGVANPGQKLVLASQGYPRAYVFQWLPDKTVKDICMFTRDPSAK